MSEINEILKTYDEIGTFKGTAKKMMVSKNTVKRYVKNRDDFQEGKIKNIYNKNIEKVIKKSELEKIVIKYLEDNLSKPKKQNITGKQIYRIISSKNIDTSYSTVKRIIKDWKIKYLPREVYIKQEHDPGKECEFDFGDVIL